MVREFAKPLPARRIEARGRAREKGVRVAVIVAGRRYISASQSEPGTVHTIARTPVGWACSCLGYEHTGCCRHLGQVERRAAREGWRFGTVAPLDRVADHMPLEPVVTIAARLVPVTPTPVDLAAVRERGRQARAELFG